MKITSPAFQDNAFIPSQYTCDGDNVNPPLDFEDVPSEAQSLVLICHDPDAPKEDGWTHWVVVNLEPNTRFISENSKPSSGTETVTDFGRVGYGGPCPHSGVHRYIFYLYALRQGVELDSTWSKDDIVKKIEPYVIDCVTLVGKYKKA